MSSVFDLIGDITAPFALITQNARAIGTIIPDVVIEETSVDQTQITDHPVEMGAAISDHAFNLPPEVEMRCGFSDSTAGSEGYVQEVYQEFLSLKAQREPFDVSTGKRQFPNMLIQSLQVKTDNETEHTLMIVVGLRGVIITQTQASAGAPQSAQAMPQQTAPNVDTGTQQLAPLSNFPTIPGSSTGATAPLSNFPLIPGAQGIV